MSERKKISIIKNITLKEDFCEWFENGRKIIEKIKNNGRDDIIDLLNKGIKGEIKLGFGNDFDQTVVNTREKERFFPKIGEDPKGVKQIYCAFLMLEIPIAIITGNSNTYLKLLAFDPIRKKLQSLNLLKMRKNLSAYCSNGAVALLYDSNGDDAIEDILEYEDRWTMPIELVNEISEYLFTKDFQDYMKMHLNSPIIVDNIREEHRFITPDFQIRKGNNSSPMQISIIGIYGEERQKLLEGLVKNFSKNKYFFDLAITAGGEYSIDIQHRDVGKDKAGAHFMIRNNLDAAIFFGDSVTVSEKGEGNDFKFIHVEKELKHLSSSRNKKIYVFSVNPEEKPVPQHNNIIHIGNTPSAVRDFYAWYLIEKINYLICNRLNDFSENILSNLEKLNIIEIDNKVVI